MFYMDHSICALLNYNQLYDGRGENGEFQSPGLILYLAPKPSHQLRRTKRQLSRLEMVGCSDADLVLKLWDSLEYVFITFSAAILNLKRSFSTMWILEPVYHQDQTLLEFQAKVRFSLRIDDNDSVSLSSRSVKSFGWENCSMNPQHTSGVREDQLVWLAVALWNLQDQQSYKSCDGSIEWTIVP